MDHVSLEGDLRAYARLLLRALGFEQKARPLFIQRYSITDVHGAHLAVILAQEAYRLGAPLVDDFASDMKIIQAKFACAPGSDKARSPDYFRHRVEEAVRTDAAWVALYGQANLGIVTDAKHHSAWQEDWCRVHQPLMDRQLSMRQPWLAIIVPSEAWAAKLGISIRDLWEEIFRISGVTQKDPLAYMDHVAGSLEKRTRLLNDLQIETLQFEGPGTDFKIGLSYAARWIGGRAISEDGTSFLPNWPTYEVYTTPDWRTAEGKVRIVRPAVVSGKVVEEFFAEFSGGELVSFDTSHAESNSLLSEVFSIAGGDRIGEIALVAGDNPLVCSERIFYMTALDEQTGCHFALGKSFLTAIDGGSEMSPEELSDIGCNRSSVHFDFTISDSSTTVTGLTRKGDRLTLISEGQWTEEFA